MLKNNSIVEYYKYNVDLIKPIQFTCRLAFDISLLKNPNFSISNLFDPDFTEELNIDFENLPADLSNDDLIAWLGSQIATFYNKTIISNLDLSNTQVLLLHQTSRTIYVLNKRNRVIDKSEDREESNKKDTVKNSFVKLLKKIEIIKTIVSKINDEDVRKCIENSIKIEFDEIYHNCISIYDTVPFDVPYLKYAHLDEELVEKDAIDLQDVWINKEKFKQFFEIEIGADQDISALIKKDDNSELGIVYNDYVFPIRPKINLVVKEVAKSEFHWIQIKEVFKINDNKKGFQSELIDDFKSRIKDKKFTNLLSHLKENLYLKSSLLDDLPSFVKFFSSSLKISDVKYLKKFNFFITDSISSGDSFGIYAFDKLAEDATHFNLIHWYKRLESGVHNKYRDNTGPQKVKTDVESVSTLHPEISFYFITKYFEDFVQTILDELNINYLNNFHLFNGTSSLGEFDFLIKSGNTFYFVEVKTTLSKFYINDYRKKCKKLLDVFSTFGINLEFIIIGAYSNNTVEDLKFYIDHSHKGNKRYNRPNEEILTTPYTFKVPIDNTDKKIICIAESNYTLLKKSLNKICQT